MKTILVVDDDSAIRDTLKRILEYPRDANDKPLYKVITASDGESAFARQRETKLDLVMLDIKMPGMDGMTVLQRMKEYDGNISVVMISAHGSIDTALEATRLGAIDFLQKPPDRDELLFRVKKAIDSKQLASDYRILKEKVENREAILGQSQKIRDVLAIVDQVAPTDSGVAGAVRGGVEPRAQPVRVGIAGPVRGCRVHRRRPAPGAQADLDADFRPDHGRRQTGLARVA